MHTCEQFDQTVLSITANTFNSLANQTSASLTDKGREIRPVVPLASGFPEGRPVDRLFRGWYPPMTWSAVRPCGRRRKRPFAQTFQACERVARVASAPVDGSDSRGVNAFRHGRLVPTPLNSN